MTPTALHRWLDDTQIIRAIGRYFRALDEQEFADATFRQILTADARVIRPNGDVMTGVASIVNSHARSFARFEASQHLLTDHAVDVDGDAASVRANLVAIHLWKGRPAAATLLERSFSAGGVIRASMRRTSEGWRIAELSNRVLWRAGDFGTMLDTR
ncbi:nuclear transport factor 2 family protein [Deinococcus sonorensis]|uniref:Nuclear transport factor 2 family protein n=2 Tax=Deinococcus sonorensis TaxID=309891 RepID=A0AAU7U6T1_9DEIO